MSTPKITKTQFEFYRQKKIPTLCGQEFDAHKISIHAVINSKTGYDPFQMKKKGTDRHNAMSTMKMMFKSYQNQKNGLSYGTTYTQEHLVERFSRNKYLARYVKRLGWGPDATKEHQLMYKPD